MRRITKIFLYTLICLVVGLGVALPAFAAGSATLYLSPASASVASGSNLVVKVYEDSGSTGVNAVQANLTYPTNLLSYVSYASSSAFSVEAENPGGNSGSLRFARGSITPRTGAQLVVTITFKAVTGSGTANVSFASGSSVINSTDNSDILSGTTGGKYTLTKAASSSSSSGSSGSTAAPAKGDKTPPTITDIQASAISETSAVISWKTSEPATSEVSYGEDTQHQISTTDTNLVTDHKVTLGFGVLTKGQAYHYRVKSADAAGNKAESQDLTFSTAGVKPQAAATPAKTDTNIGRVAAVAGGSALLVAAAASTAVFYRRRGRTHAELQRHFPGTDNNDNPAPPPPTTGPTIINPTVGPKT
ncbi:hypothetical protein HY379_01620 [Candidatus Saccharibacteria bacterium]|nr:hypothetical protein [Candidatus Saccharibacteria bacterium]